MTNSLYSLIKKISQQKGKKLKIICNINDIVRPMKSSAIYGVSKKDIPFKKYHEIFWEKRDYENKDGVQGADNANKQKIKESIKRFEDYQKERGELRKTIADKKLYEHKCSELEKKYMGNSDYLSNRPFTTVAADLLREKNLVEEIVFGIASWTKEKQNLPSVLNKVRIDEFTESFKRFSESFFINGDNQRIADYWERAMIIRPDFDRYLNSYFRSW